MAATHSSILPQTSRPEILDFEVSATTHANWFDWEVFDVQTAVIIASGGAKTRTAAQLAALAIIADRKQSWRFVVKTPDAIVLRLQDAAGGAVWLPLPLTAAADASMVYAYVNSLPGTAGRPVEVVEV